ncbi:hypothetical protein T552_02182 [Pneumocystis carinii B80]|uniref:Tripeptidyl-peptidase 2 n=1 Tax=Pneumocystis carinii (strain B80) TaxID=1408658 RepID=A0A0W4ZH96_PNEC8|nr:hypothetical protein T552_02182 [Pneumocystis carinii B80]KTW27743.1 hypothetical protein T552_02182 [Pneumocystis carinii B80]
MSELLLSSFLNDSVYSFPVEGLLPKDETESQKFVKKYTEYDGRGVTVAVLDTGVDPSAAGLQKTTDGKIKIVNLIDCSGSGDVDVSTVAEVYEEEGVLKTKGLTGRILKINKEWKNRDGKWYIGVKRGYEIFPDSLITRLKKKRHETFNQQHITLLAQMQYRINMFKEEHKDESKFSKEEMDLKQDLEAQYDVLKEMMSNYEDPGPIFDCLVWHDGKNWRAVVDTDEEGDLIHKKPMCDYHIEHHYEYFSKQDMLCYSVNIYDNGSVLSLVTLCGSHGTHVSGIIGANHPDDPDLNGVAPGVQIVSLKIGDARLGSLETNHALLRAAIAMVNLGVDIANMSYGESTGINDAGIFIDILRKFIIGKKDIIFVSSAGNSGPALSTVGTPGGTTSGVISVGAYVTASMIKAEYSIFENVPEGKYTWSSRGPSTNGAKGLTIYAPGAAITSVPTYVLSRSQLMNGTSMSSPSACGGICLILSALKAQKIKYTPPRIYKAIENASKNVSDVMNVGFLQVEKSYDYFIQHINFLDQDFDFEILINNSSFNGKGIYLREFEETNHLHQITIEIKPTLKDEEILEKNALELRLVLLSSKPWVKAPNYLLLNAAGRIFDVQVDPVVLSSGFHYAEIVAYDTIVPKRRIFAIPVSVCKPELILKPLVSWKNILLASGYIERKFIRVPDTSNWVELRVRTKKIDTSIKIFIHFTQLVQNLRLNDTEHKFFLKLHQNELILKQFAVIPGVTMEICFANLWLSIASGEIDVELEFHGLKLSSNKINLALSENSQSIKRVEVINTLAPEIFEPSLKLNSLKRTFYPSFSSIRPLGERDVFPDSKTLFEMILTYPLKFLENTEATFLMPLSGSLYDSSFCMLTALFNRNKRLLQFKGVEPIKAKLKAGEYVYRVRLIHDSILVLEKVKNITLSVIQSIGDSKEFSLNIFNDHIDAFNKEKSQDFNMKLHQGDRKSIVISTFIDPKQLPKDAKNGDKLLGQLHLEDKTRSLKKAGYDVEINLILESKESAPPKDESIIDLQVQVLNKIKDSEEKKNFLNELLRLYPNELSVLNARLETILKFASDDEIIDAANAIIAFVDFEKITEYIRSEQFSNTNLSSDQKKEKEKLEQQKSILLKALQKKAEILGRTSDGILSKEFDDAFEKCRKWMEFPGKDYDFFLLQIRRFIARKHYGLALQLILKLESDSSYDLNESELTKIYQLKIDILKTLDWSIWETYHEKWKLILNPPKGYILF